MRNSFSGFKMAIALSKSGSKEDVARRMNVTPGHVIREIRYVEKDIGMNLFVKEGNTFVTTPDGYLLLSKIDSENKEICQFLRSRKTDCLRIGFDGSILAYSFISPIFDHYKNDPEHPLLLNVFEHNTLVSKLQQGLIDIAVTAGDSVSMDVPAHLKGEFELNLLVAERDPLCLTESFITPSMASLKPLVTSERIYRACFTDWLRKEDVTIICCNDMLFLYALILRGNGCGIVPYCADSTQNLLPLKAMPFYPAVRAPFDVFISRNDNALARTAQFLDMLRANAEHYHMIFK